MSGEGLRVSVLGCGSAMPTPWHNPSCQVVAARSTLYMIDCGEGAQTAMRRLRLPMNRLRHIFISHLHGDHLLGLPGLLSTMALQDAGGEVTVYIHADGIRLLQPLVDTLCADRPYRLTWRPLDPRGGETLVDDGALTVTSFPLVHRVDANGFRFDEKPRARHLRADMLEFHGVPLSQRNLIRQGADFVRPDGRVVANGELTLPPTPSLSYAYASDTAASEAVARACAGVTLLYHEATYGDEFAAKAAARGHSTARQAGEIAARAGAAALMIGHYSKRYHDVEPLRLQAAEAFGGPVIAAQEGLTVDLSDLPR